MSYAIKIVGLVQGFPSVHDGKWLVDYDPSPDDQPIGHCLLRTSANKEHARRFKTREDAHYLWTRIDGRQPVRADGRLNRPLTAYSVFITEVDA